jgi:hypothetical protein
VPDRHPTERAEVAAGQQSDTDRFYALLDELSTRVGGPVRLRECTSSRWPCHGVTFFFEDGEARLYGSPRVVRVGAHALTAKSTSTLWNKLCAHRGCVSGSRPGGGNHRASSFRLRVGTAVLSQGQWPPEVRDGWRDKRADFHARDCEYPVEHAVTMHIGSMPFLWLAVPDRTHRAMILRHTIALLSRRSGGVDPASSQWLGLAADSEKVRTSALWNVEHVDEAYDPLFLNILERLVRTV